MDKIFGVRAEMVRDLMGALIFAGLVWVGQSIERMSVATARLQVQLTEVQAQLAPLPQLQSDIDRMQVTQVEHERRIAKLENGPQ